MFLFGDKAPKIKREEIDSFGMLYTLGELFDWFQRHDKRFRFLVNNESIKALLEEGFYPSYAESRDVMAKKVQDLVKHDMDSQPAIFTLKSWFPYRIFLDIYAFKEAGQTWFRAFLDGLVEKDRMAMSVVRKMARDYSFDAQTSDWNEETKKIPKEKRQEFKQGWLDETLLNAEVRLLGWIYHEFFDEWYQPKRIGKLTTREVSSQQQIIDEYEKVLKEHADVVSLCAPESLLPYPREDINEALEAAIRKEPKKNRDRFQYAFASLWSFIPDEDAEVCKNILDIKHKEARGERLAAKEASAAEKFKKISAEIHERQSQALQWIRIV